MSSPLLWAGNFAKFLKAQINIDDAAYILTGGVDPSVVATLAPCGSQYLNTSSGTMYLKQDAGLSTNWLKVIAGAEADPLSIHINGTNSPTADINWNSHQITGLSGLLFNSGDIGSHSGSVMVNCPNYGWYNDGLYVGNTYDLNAAFVGGGAISVVSDNSTTIKPIMRLTGYGSTPSTGTPFYFMQRARGTVAAPAAVINNDVLGGINTLGYDGANFYAISTIQWMATGSWTSNPTYHPGQTLFKMRDPNAAESVVVASLDYYQLSLGVQSPGISLTFNRDGQNDIGYCANSIGGSYARTGFLRPNNIYAKTSVRIGTNGDYAGYLAFGNKNTVSTAVAGQLILEGQGGTTGAVVHVDLSTPATNNQALLYNSTSGTWVPGTAGQAFPPSNDLPMGGYGFTGLGNLVFQTISPDPFPVQVIHAANSLTFLTDRMPDVMDHAHRDMLWAFSNTNPYGASTLRISNGGSSTDINPGGISSPEGSGITISSTDTQGVTAYLTVAARHDSYLVTGEADYNSPNNASLHLVTNQARPAGIAGHIVIPSLAAPSGQTYSVTIDSSGNLGSAPSYSGMDSVTINAYSQISLVNDSATPGNSQYYGTDSSGVRGYHTFSVPTQYWTLNPAVPGPGGWLEILDPNYGLQFPFLASATGYNIMVTDTDGKVTSIPYVAPENDWSYNSGLDLLAVATGNSTRVQVPKLSVKDGGSYNYWWDVVGGQVSSTFSLKFNDNWGGSLNRSVLTITDTAAAGASEVTVLNKFTIFDGSYKSSFTLSTATPGIGPQVANLSYQLPPAQGGNSDFLRNDGNGNMYWNQPQLVGLADYNYLVSPSDGYVLTFNATASKWEPRTLPPPSSQYWSEAAGTLYPVTSTDRVLIGGATDDTASALQVAGTTVTGLLRLRGVTSDPTSPVDGSIWYRSDNKEFRVRIDGVTYKLPVSPI